MAFHFSTRSTLPYLRQQAWHDVVGTVYFQLQVALRQPELFDGEIASWQLGDLSLSYLSSSAAQYQRLKQHLSYTNADEAFLITVPIQSKVEFEQLGRHSTCAVGEVLFELSHEPYRFSYGSSNRLWVLKVPHKVMKQYVTFPERYGGLHFDARHGAGYLFSQLLCLTGEQLRRGLLNHGHDFFGTQLLQLFGQMVQTDNRLLTDRDSSVKSVHLLRIEQYVQKHLHRNDLNPQQVAEACQISVRYLHALFQTSHLTFGQWLMAQRLEGAHAYLLRQRSKVSLAQVAYQWGFADQAHFSRRFKQYFGCSPKDMLIKTG